MIASAVAALAGGVGLFLLGMRLMTNGLKLAAGRSLRRVLGTWTKSLTRGILSGFMITALVQSSSAVTVAVIGFVNAGILDLVQSIGVIYGSNIGTTVTGWIVAAVGLSLKVKALALPLIGAGMILRLTGSRSRRGPLGEALAGFGIFFLGIDVLQGAFQGLGANLDLAQLSLPGPLAVLVFAGIGFALTMLMQSSSAAMALVLTAAAGGMIDLTAAAGAVIGTNIGTTSTAALSVIGATANAKKVAGAHIIFNLGTGTIALITLPLLLKGVTLAGNALGLEPEPAPVLALFHTTFNLLGVLVIAPFTRQVAAFLNRLIGRKAQDAGTPMYLDKTVLSTPSLALDALLMELARLRSMVGGIGARLLSDDKKAHAGIVADKESADTLIQAVRDFTLSLQETDLTQGVAAKLPVALRVAQYCKSAGDMAQECVQIEDRMPPFPDEPSKKAAEGFVDYCRYLIHVCDNPCAEEFAGMGGYLADLSDKYHLLKDRLLAAGGSGTMDPTAMVEALEHFSRIHRMLKRLVKAAMYWASIREKGDICPDPSTPSAFAWNRPW